MSAIDLNMSFAHAALPLGWLLIIVRIIQNWVDPLEKNNDESTPIPVKKG
jgi:TRAP-type C4-dicarboxylate transport system permease small subunit